MLPTGRPLEGLDIPGVGRIDATLINAGNPMIFVAAESLGLRGNELQGAVNENREQLGRCEAVRAHAAVAMGLATSPEEATLRRPATPKLALIAAPRDYTAAGGREVSATDIDLNVRVLSMGRLHHAIPGTAAIAVAVAASIPGTLVQRVLNGTLAGRELRLGHPSGVTITSAETSDRDGRLIVTKASISRSARRLMEGWVAVPSDTITTSEVQSGEGVLHMD
jgi:hypothetical protein